MSGLSSISGLIAGFDTKAAVEELLAPRQYQIDKMVQKQEAEAVKQEAFGELNTMLLDFKNISLGMNNPDNFFSYTATLASNNASVPASNLLDVTGDSSVSAGNHKLVVHALAQEQRLSSSSAVKDNLGTAAVSSSASLGLTGSFQIGATTISVGAADSLDDVANTINQQNATTGVSASVVKVNVGDFRLVLAADNTGATGFTLSGADLDDAGALSALQVGAVGQLNAQSQLQAPQDAQLEIDGLTITRSSNKISDAVSGLTFNLKQADPTVSATMSIGVDTAAVQSSVDQFILAYNDLVGFINDQFVFNADTESNGVLATESVLTSIQRSLTSTMLQSIPGLQSDRNTMVEVGIEFDDLGQLQYNDTLFSNFLNNDPTAIRDVFVATGSSANLDLNFLVPGLASTSGTYNVNITTAATQASVTGTTDLSAGLAANQTLTLTEAGSSRQAIMNFTAGQTLTSMVSALNTEFAQTTTETRQMSSALTVAAAPANGSNSFDQLALGMLAGDTISISGTSRTGGSVSSTFSILDPATDTISDLLAAIQVAFNQQVAASVDVNGRIQLTDTTSGDSQLSMTLTANNEGGGTLNFGTDTLVTEGRFSMGLEAVASGNNISIQSKSYGSSSGFTIAQSVNGLGIADATHTGIDVAGTIGGEAATGSGQTLSGASGVVDGMAILYGGTATGAVGDIVLGMGSAALFEGTMDLYANPFSGLIQNTIVSSQDQVNSIESRIQDLQLQLEKQRQTLTRSFTAMESAMATLNATGSFLTAQTDAKNAAN